MSEEQANDSSVVQAVIGSELVEGLAMLAFFPGGLPRMPHLCEAQDAQELARAYIAFTKADQPNDECSSRKVHPDETELVQKTISIVQHQERQRSLQGENV